MTPGQLLRAERMKRGISQDAVAYMLRTTRDCVARWERGEGTPTPRNRRRIARFLGMTVEELWPDKVKERTPIE